MPSLSWCWWNVIFLCSAGLRVRSWLKLIHQYNEYTHATSWETDSFFPPWDGILLIIMLPNFIDEETELYKDHMEPGPRFVWFQRLCHFYIALEIIKKRCSLRWHLTVEHFLLNSVNLFLFMIFSNWSGPFVHSWITRPSIHPPFHPSFTNIIEYHAQ